MNTRSMVLSDYTDLLASSAAVPGGGGASALSGALAACLAQMVCNLTVGKKRYAEYEEDIKGILKELKEHTGNFYVLADRDAEVFEPLSKAYSLPSSTQEEAEYKSEVMEPLLANAAEVPMQIMEEAISMLDALLYLKEKGSRLAVSDVGVAVMLLRTALTGAMMNVKINTKAMKNRENAALIDTKAFRLLKEGMEGADRLYNSILEEL